MAQSQTPNNFDAKKQEIITSAYTGPDILSTYDANFDADNFLYNSVPFGEYPEVSSSAIRDKGEDSNSQP